jgi:hypothetical protein
MTVRERLDPTDYEKFWRDVRGPGVVDHPDYYGGEDNPYEAIKIIEAYDLNFSLGNVIKYVLRAGKKNESAIEDLEKAARYIQFQIDYLRRQE